MFLIEKSPRSYVGLYQKFLYKSFSLLLTPPPPNVLLTPPPMQLRLRLEQGAQCYVIPKKLCLSAVVSAHFPNALLTQQLDDLRVTHQSQVTCHGLSYEAVFFSSETITRETFHFTKRFAVVREEGIAEGLFDKEPDPTPPEIHNSSAPPSTPGDHIEAGVFNASNREEDISLVRNEGLEVDNDMKPAPKSVPSFDTPAAETIF